MACCTDVRTVRTSIHDGVHDARYWRGGFSNEPGGQQRAYLATYNCAVMNPTLCRYAMPGVTCQPSLVNDLIIPSSSTPACQILVDGHPSSRQGLTNHVTLHCIWIIASGSRLPYFSHPRELREIPSMRPLVEKVRHTYLPT